MNESLAQHYLDDAIASFRTYKKLAEKALDQLKDEEETIRREAEGARSLILGLDDDGQIVLRFDVGVSKAEAIDALIDGGLERES